MPIVKPCLDCGELSTESRCPAHTRSHERRRLENEPWRKFYSLPQWFKTSWEVRERDGWRCTFEASGRRCATTELLSVHHEEKLRNIWKRAKGDWSLFLRWALDKRKLRTLCSRHHQLVDNNNPAKNWVGVPGSDAGRAATKARRQIRSARRRRRGHRKPYKRATDGDDQ